MMRPRWMPLWLWWATAYRPVLVRSINLRTAPSRGGLGLDDLVVTVEDWRGHRWEVIRTGFPGEPSGKIDDEVTCIGIRESRMHGAEGT